MAQGNYDHPSYLTRQALILGATTAGASGTSGSFSFISDMRVRKFSAAVRTAGTTTGAASAVALIYIGTSVSGYNLNPVVLTTVTTTATVGTLTLGTSVANAVSTSTDMNALLKAGGLLQMKNGTDATSVASVVLEAYIDPAGQWTGPNN